MSVTIEERPPTVDDYLRLRDAVGWDSVPRDDAAAAMENSRFAVTAVDGGEASADGGGTDADGDEAAGEVIGCGRIVGDDLYFYLQDVVVHPDRQGEGVGAALMDGLLAWVDAEVPETAFVGLMAATGAAGFYEQYGFEARGPDEPGMVLVRE